MTERSATTFLRRSGWGHATIMPLPGDASTRRYARLEKDGQRALLMDQPPNAESPVAPAEASPEERAKFGYNALARLAGTDINRFIAVANYLRGRGLTAPEIYAADTDQGYLVIEDFGDDLFANLATHETEEELYKTAVEALARLHAEPAPTNLSPSVLLHTYDEAALLAETDLLTEWFFPLALGRPVTDNERCEHRELWQEALTGITGDVLVHRDYHAQNLIWMPQRADLRRVGMIDFQDAVAGSRAYDLVSLTEDARRDVSPDLAEKTLSYYLAAMRAQGTPLDSEQFDAERAMMAAQRNAKIVGIFARLYKRDRKPHYMALLPRVWDHLERDLAHPSLASLRAWYDRTIPRRLRLPKAEKEMC